MSEVDVSEMSSWGNICRVCASPAEYDIFDKIPVYLHANYKEFLNWQSPIYELVQDTTGLKVSWETSAAIYVCMMYVVQQ